MVSPVGGQQALVVRIIEVPKMSEKELAETMKWRWSAMCPSPPPELQMDYKIIDRPDTPPEAQTMEVLLAVAQQEMITTHGILVGAGLDPVAIDGPLALARSLVDAQDPERQKQTVAIVNVGALFTDISIVRDGTLLFQRTIATGGNSLTEAIAGATNVSREHADRIKKMKAAVDPRPMRFSLLRPIPLGVARRPWIWHARLRHSRWGHARTRGAHAVQSLRDRGGECTTRAEPFATAEEESAPQELNPRGSAGRERTTGANRLRPPRRGAPQS